jgi:hypothetical protein
MNHMINESRLWTIKKTLNMRLNKVGSPLAGSHCLRMSSLDKPQHKNAKAREPEHARPRRTSCFVMLEWKLDKIQYVVPGKRRGILDDDRGYFHERR